MVFSSLQLQGETAMDTQYDLKSDPIAIVGMGERFPF